MRPTFKYVPWAAVVLALAPGWAAGQPIPMPDHVVIAIMENKTFNEIIGSANAPYINGLASQGALLTNSFAITHPSQPNYVALFSGSTAGIIQDDTPTSLPFTRDNLGAQVIASGRTFAGYSETMPSVGYTGDTFGASGYARKHNPWVNWQQTGVGPPPPNQLAPTTNQPFTAFPLGPDYSTLPTVSFVVPNLLDDMHDGSQPGSIVTGDTWLHNNIDGYAQWAKTHNSLLILTFDEDDQSATNQITTLLVGQPVLPGVMSNQLVDHYGLLATVEDMYGLGRIGNAVGASAISGVFTPVPEPGSLALVAGAGLAGMIWRRRNRPTT